MVRVEMLVVGRELLIGRTINTNAHWIGRRLALMGTMITRMTTVDDDLEEISSSLRETLGRNPEFLIVAGGLGPTPDDMTLEGVAMGLGRKLTVNRDALRLIRDHYSKIGRGGLRISPSRRKMAMLPEGATPCENEVGTAPGVRIPVGRTVIFCLPGVPGEMKSIFRRSVEQEIRRKVGRLYRKATRLKIEGIFESAMAPMIRKELDEHPGVYIKSHPRGLRGGISRIELDVVAVKEKKEDAIETAKKITKEFVRKVQEAGGTIRSAQGMRADKKED